MRDIVGISLAALIVSGCVTAGQKPIATTPRFLTADETKAIQAGLRKDLKDPESARFGTVIASAANASGVIYVCGMVNAKNSYGGYVGDKPFIGTLSHVTVPRVFTVEAVGGDVYEVAAIRQLCAQRGLGAI